MTLRESWLATGATQSGLYKVIERLFGINAIDKSTFERALRGGHDPEARTKAQISRACSEIIRSVSREPKSM
jgi:hypothetical protein